REPPSVTVGGRAAHAAERRFAGVRRIWMTRPGERGRREGKVVDWGNGGTDLGGDLLCECPGHARGGVPVGGMGGRAGDRGFRLARPDAGDCAAARGSVRRRALAGVHGAEAVRLLAGDARLGAAAGRGRGVLAAAGGRVAGAVGGGPGGGGPVPRAAAELR